MRASLQQIILLFILCIQSTIAYYQNETAIIDLTGEILTDNDVIVDETTILDAILVSLELTSETFQIDGIEEVSSIFDYIDNNEFDGIFSIYFSSSTE
eukprot:76003_1